MGAIDKIIEDSYVYLKEKWWGLPLLGVGFMSVVAFAVWNSLPNSVKERLLSSPHTSSQLPIQVALTKPAGGHAQKQYPDISGYWKNPETEGHMMKQDGKKVWYDLNNNGFRHRAEGTFVNYNTIEMMQTRERIEDRCTTHVKLTLTINESADAMDVRWENMDNNCDLKAGINGETRAWKQN
jgi:hypothetical protein